MSTYVSHVCLGAISLIVCGDCSHGLLATTTGQTLPLKTVARSRPADGYVFDRPSVVLLVRVHSRTEQRDTGIDEVPGEETRNRFWTYVTAGIEDVLRVNERRSEEPDLKDWHLRIEQQDRREKPISLQFGRLYLLLLNPSPRNDLF